MRLPTFPPPDRPLVVLVDVTVRADIARVRAGARGVWARRRRSQQREGIRAREGGGHHGRSSASDVQIRLLECSADSM